jgi:hypothetical protein
MNGYCATRNETVNTTTAEVNDLIYTNNRETVHLEREFTWNIWIRLLQTFPLLLHVPAEPAVAAEPEQLATDSDSLSVFCFMQKICIDVRQHGR